MSETPNVHTSAHITEECEMRYCVDAGTLSLEPFGALTLFFKNGNAATDFARLATALAIEMRNKEDEEAERAGRGE